MTDNESTISRRGVNTIKGLLSRKVKQVKVMVKAGYKVLLKDKNVSIN
ncbi:MAG: hypothetical protein IPH34_16570 [Chitinophagaceae bacterium]|nr:hypothetical protein [Chitinophagaceae bacterium]